MLNIIKPFNLINTIPLTRTKTLANNLLTVNEQVLVKEHQQHKLPIFEIVILNTK